MSGGGGEDDRASLLERIARLEKINASLIDRVERTVDGQGEAYALFESNILMQQVIRERTEELAEANRSLQAEVAERRRAEEAMRRARDAAEAASRAKSQFLANMSHEIRTPLTALIGFAEVLRDDGVGAAQAAEAVEIIHRNGTHLLAIINDILDLSKLESGEFRIERGACDPVEAAGEVVTMLAQQAQGLGLRIVLEAEDGAGAEIETDRLRLRQVLVNLVGNALKFTPEGGVRVRVLRRVTLGGGARVRFEVEDDGPGMDAATLGRVFDPFFQGDGSMTRRHGGVGLGLSISRRLAEALGGTLTARSVVGEGSTFVLELPGIAPASGAGRSRTERPVVSAKAGASPAARVLLVEDGLDNQRLLCHLLRREGWSVELASNGAEALACVDEAESPFDVILMDMQMPVMDGYTATQRLRASGVRTPVIALTAHAMEGDRERCLAAGCDDYLTKPVDRGRLAATVRRALLHRSAA